MTYDDIQAWVDIATVIAAVVAIIISIRAEMRSQARWNDDKDREKEIATANARPLLSISSVGYENRRGLRLTNDGIGPAIITEVTIKKGDRSGNTVAEVISLGKPVVWDTFRRFRPPLQPIAAGQERMIIELTAAGLKSKEIQGCENTNSEVDEMMGKLKDELRAVQIQIIYTDIFGNVQPTCQWNAENEVSATS